MHKPVQIVPAILTDDPAALKKMVRRAETFAKRVQFDIMDGHFVPSQSITERHITRLKAKLDWEAHLMVQHPEQYLAGFQQAGAKRIIFHYETTPSPREVIALGRSLKIEVGLAVNPDTPISKITPLADEVDCVLFMSVHPGFYGSKFIPEALDKVSAFRLLYPNMEIGIDGGINEYNIARAVRAGANSICIGSAIFCQPDPAESYKRLVALVNEASASL